MQPASRAMFNPTVCETFLIEQAGTVNIVCIDNKLLFTFFLSVLNLFLNIRIQKQ